MSIRCALTLLNLLKADTGTALSTLSKKDLDGIIADGEDIEVKCQFCNTAYKFTVDELKEMR